MKVLGRALLAFFLLVGFSAGAGVAVAAEVSPGWKRVEIPATGSYLWRYVPGTVLPGVAPPMVLFLHGAGGTPDAYKVYVKQAAERAGCVVVMPKSTTSLGWGIGQDELTVDESLRLVGEEVGADPRRIAAAGHSAGGAYAYLLTYLRPSHWSAVFTLAASAYPVDAVADPEYKAPIRMYYGTGDPNYYSGPYAALKAQWQRLGVSWEEDVRPGYDHGSWPIASMTDGFLFLTAHSYPELAARGCTEEPDTLCLLGGRFRAEVVWHDSHGGTGAGYRVPGASDTSGLFWFFSPDNWEMMVKAIDACSPYGSFWIFSAGTTDVGYTLTVTDTRTGRSVHYDNPPGQAAAAITDTAAFECP